MFLFSSILNYKLAKIPLSISLFYITWFRFRFGYVAVAKLLVLYLLCVFRCFLMDSLIITIFKSNDAILKQLCLWLSLLIFFIAEIFFYLGWYPCNNYPIFFYFDYLFVSIRNDFILIPMLRVHGMFWPANVTSRENCAFWRKSSTYRMATVAGIQVSTYHSQTKKKWPSTRYVGHSRETICHNSFWRHFTRFVSTRYVKTRI